MTTTTATTATTATTTTTTTTKTRLTKIEKTVASLIKKTENYYQQNREERTIEILQLSNNSDKPSLYWQLNNPSIAFRDAIEDKCSNKLELNYSDYNPDYADSTIFTSGKELSEAIRATAYAIATDSTSQQLNCLAVVPNGTSLGGAIATDAHRMAIYGNDLDPNTESYVLIPLRVVAAIEKLIKAIPSCEIKIENSDRITKISVKDEYCLPIATLSFTRIQGVYPKCLGLVPSVANRLRWQFYSQGQLGVLRTKLTDYNYRNFFLNFEKGYLEVQTDNKYPQQIVRMEIRSDKEFEAEVIVDGKLLAEVLDRCNYDTEIYIGAYNEPLVFKNDRDLHLLMPKNPKFGRPCQHE